MTHDEMIAVIQADKEGKTVQCRFKSRPSDRWSNCVPEPAWDFATFDYRIKPEPREPRVIWVNEYDGELGLGNYTTEIAAKEGRLPSTPSIPRKFIEVIEEGEA